MLVTEANAFERLGAIIVLHEAQEKLQKLEVVWVDQGYSGKNFAENVVYLYDSVTEGCGTSEAVFNDIEPVVEKAFGRLVL